jgi:seryl-tRNA synthetase|tara:strand:+ start:8841 stop:9209 length:369 start_codon:yes stop_codon:yes gene_type:complete
MISRSNMGKEIKNPARSSKKQSATSKNKNVKTVKKVISGLEKASKTHASQAKKLSSTLKMKEGKKVKSRVNEAGNYTKPTLRKRLFNQVKAGSSGGNPGQWSARKAQILAKKYKEAGGGYTS